MDGETLAPPRLTAEQMRANLAQFTDDWEYIDRVVQKLTGGRQARKDVRPAQSVAKTYEETMTEASEALLEAVQLAQRGWTPKVREKLIWHDLRTTWGDPESENAQYTARRLEAIQAREDRTESRRIAPRDPCGMCGVRRDIGCKHHPAGF
jgi:hypothetical protein